MTDREELIDAAIAALTAWSEGDIAYLDDEAYGAAVLEPVLDAVEPLIRAEYEERIATLTDALARIVATTYYASEPHEIARAVLAAQEETT